MLARRRGRPHNSIRPTQEAKRRPQVRAGGRWQWVGGIGGVTLGRRLRDFTTIVMVVDVWSAADTDLFFFFCLVNSNIQ